MQILTETLSLNKRTKLSSKHNSKTEIKSVIRQGLEKSRVQDGASYFHTRGNDRGGLMRLCLEDGSSVVAKVWHLGNFKERLKSILFLSNGWREWHMHRLIYNAGVEVPEPLSYHRLTLKNGGGFEVMLVEDLGKTDKGLLYLKNMAAAGNEAEIVSFEKKLIEITKRFFDSRILDIDHQLNNFVVDPQGHLIRIDFECAWHSRIGRLPRKGFAEMLARLIASHIYAVQPDVRRSERFADQLYRQLRIDRRLRKMVQTSVNMKLEAQSRNMGVVTSVRLPC